MKILVVGDGHSDIHEEVVAEAFRLLEHQVDVFFWHEYFRSTNIFVRQWLRVQNKFIVGPQIKRINRDFLDKVSLFMPYFIFIYRGTHIFASTILAIKKQIPACKILGYNNDDPFAIGHRSYLWRHFIASVPHYDIVCAYRHHNIQQLLGIGAKRVELLRSWFVPWLNKPAPVSTENRDDSFRSDVVFVGHYEPDNRVSLLELIVRSGWKLRLFGPGWDPVIRSSSELSGQIPVRSVWGDDYNEALSRSRIALCFLSKLNRDTYTRRCFEIPATRTLMLSEYTADLASMFREGEEVEFFRNPEEMINKINFYSNNETRCREVAEAGYRRVVEDGHDVVSRMRQVLAWMDKIKTGKVA